MARCGLRVCTACAISSVHRIATGAEDGVSPYLLTILATSITLKVLELSCFSVHLDGRSVGFCESVGPDGECNDQDSNNSS
jgi:hypothetical protein